MKANREGIFYVISRMDWYWHLSTLLLKEDTVNDGPSAGLRGELEKRVVDLYKELLLYQVKSVCSYYRNRSLAVLRDVIKLDDWDGSLQGIQGAEKALERDSKIYNNQKVRSTLQTLAETAKDREMELLQGINQTLQDQASQQMDIMIREENRECLRALCVIDPEVEIREIEGRKDSLLQDSYGWILTCDEYKNFISWTDNNPHRLLWIKGDAGKGKTMLLIGIIRELSRQLELDSHSLHVSYFFIQGTDSKLNTATAVLRSLIWMMFVQNPSLISHFKKGYDPVGPQYFESNTFQALSKVFDSMLADPSLSRVYLIVDALDECVDKQGLAALLRLISTTVANSSKVKWLVSSRYRWDIESQLKGRDGRARLDLELNSESVSRAVDAYIDYKVLKLNYDRAQVADELHKRADGTFLWVALVCKILESTRHYRAIKTLEKTPSELTKLYGWMLDQIKQLEDEDPDFCKCLLSVMTLAYRPLRLSELATLANLPPDIPLIEIINTCASFLTVRDGTVYLIHQSAKDYLSSKDVEPEIFPHGCAAIHGCISSRSLDAMDELHEDIYKLQDPGCSIEEIKPINPDPLDKIRYACVFWVDHLCEIDRSLHNDIGLCDDGRIHKFLKTHLLHWLEALSLLRNTAAGAIAIRKLENLVTVSLDLFPEYTILF